MKNNIEIQMMRNQDLTAISEFAKHEWVIIQKSSLTTSENNLVLLGENSDTTDSTSAGSTISASARLKFRQSNISSHQRLNNNLPDSETGKFIYIVLSSTSVEKEENELLRSPSILGFGISESSSYYIKNKDGKNGRQIYNNKMKQVDPLATKNPM